MIPIMTPTAVDTPSALGKRRVILIPSRRLPVSLPALAMDPPESIMPMTSLIANRPIITAIRLMPFCRYSVPNVYRGTPITPSTPMKLIDTPSPHIAKPL